MKKIRTRIITLSCLLLLFLLVSSLLNPNIKKTRYVHVKPIKGEWTAKLFKRYNLPWTNCLKQKYEQINKTKTSVGLKRGKYYKLPMVIKKNNKVTQKLFKANDYKKILKYNNWLYRYGRKTNYKTDKILWVPWTYFGCNNTTSSSIISSTGKKQIYPLFGKNYQEVTIKTNKLKNHVYYLISGHGGPDPGANTKLKGELMCEDEYAYDVTLRLAKSLIEQGAKVYMIVRDKNDGIRDSEFLQYDRDEVVYLNKKIPLGQVKRLKQRTDVINKLYKKHKQKKQRCVEIHIDSRGSKQIDVFFYHHKYSRKGKKLCEILKKTFTKQYAKHQKGRGYKGSVKPRSLYMLNHTKPVMTYIELGNILHKKDRKRIINKNNRQALAKWITIGLMKEAK